jgi:anthranilate synthase/aminodeoxychorismate synthase-like glutamine amidotransferase|tara:strand:- start:144 stop:722 length:579 start_codon:yes stop_codon:yes gene_type:complete
MSSKQKILMIDNYDSFTYNLVQYLGELGADIEVFRNNKISIEKIEAIKPKKIVISPGPGIPEKAGISVKIVRAFAGKVPILGVCLGHQAIGNAFGAKIVHAGKLMHGKTSMIKHDGKTIFKNLPVPFKATRYHSLVISRDTLSDDFKITAESEDNEIMGIRHKKYFLEGIQFHPESIMTETGKDLLENFLNL